jgi:hypothetical protein
MKRTNSYLILKDKTKVPSNLRWMNWPSARNDPRTHYSLQQAASEDGFFKLNSLKSWNDTNIEIDPAKWDLLQPLIIQIFLKQLKPSESQIEGWSVNRVKPHEYKNYLKHQRLLPSTRNTYSPSSFEQLRPNWILMSLVHG